MKIAFKRVVAGVIAALTVTALVGCGSSTSSTSEGAFLVPTIADTWDTRQVASTILSISLMVTEPLITYQPDGSFENNLVSDVTEESSTSRTYTLVDGVTFSDGSPLTAADVKYSYELHMGPDTTSVTARYYTGISEIEAIDDLTVRFTLSEPDPEFDYTLARTGIVSQAAYEAADGVIGTPESPQIGTGPYQYATFKPASEVTLEPNPEYRGEAAEVTNLTFTVAKDDSTRLTAVQSGDYDGIFSPPVSQVNQIGSDASLTEFDSTGVLQYRIALDTSKAPFDDPQVRLAIAHAVDRDAVVEGPLTGQGSAAWALVPEETVETLGTDTAAVEAVYGGFAEDLDFDLDAALAALAASSVPEGFTIDMPIVSDDSTQSLIAQTIAQDLAQIGITVNIQPMELSAYYEVYVGHISDGFLLDSWNAGSPEPSNVPVAAFSPDSAGNSAALDDESVTAALDAYRALPADSPDRQTRFLEMLDAANAQLAYIPIVYVRDVAFLTQGWEMPSFNSYWWLSPFNQMVSPE